jgi:hypothetical protein
MSKLRTCLFLLPVFIIMLMAACRHKPAELPAKTKDTLLIYIMAGQSNMAGRGAVEPQDTVTNPRILTIDSAGNLVIAKEPLHFYQPGFSGLDCGVSFAGNLLPAIPAGSSICLVPCAISSTTVQQWLGDSSHGVKLYSNMLSRAQIAMQHGVLRGVLWHQGEANAEDSSGPVRYAADLEAFVLKIRKDVQDDQLPFFAGTLADFCRYPFKDSVNASIRRAANALPRIFVVSTADLSCKPDSVHFDAAGQREMGRRFAVAAKAVL